jgi:hypothetical protein
LDSKTINNSIGWSFPENNGGENDGLNDAGIETYKGSPIISLAREVIQNALDAAQNLDNNPVIVEFSLEKFSNDEIPGISKYKNILNSCLKFGSEIEKTRLFFEKALDVVNNESLPVLRISDYNTTGLTGAENDGLNNWNNLIKGNGVSNKHVGAGGSFGIGKQAPYACSNLRTVFYVTKDIEGIEAFQGNAKLITHKNKFGNKTQGTGFFGIKDGNKPVIGFDKLPSKFLKRDKIGTDIYILGFIKKDDWKINIIKSVLEHFLVAIYEEDLKVSVDDININKNNLKSLLDKYISGDSKCYADKYYRSMTSEKKEVYTNNNFKGLGSLKLYLISDKEAPKRVAMVRDTGMKIFDKGHFITHKRFAGVFTAQGEELNDFLRKMEPPSHDSWEPARHPDEKKANKIRRKLYKWLNDMVGELNYDNDAEKVDVDGMSQFLPDDLSELPLPGENELKNKDKKISDDKDIKTKDVNITPTSSKIVSGTDGGIDGNDGADDGQFNGGSGGQGGKYTGEGSGGDGSGGTSPGEENDKPTSSETPLKLDSARVFALNASKGIYSANIKVNKSTKGYLYFKVIGEDRKDFVEINKVKISDKNTLNVNGGKVGPIEFDENENLNLIIHINDNEKYAMEVEINES